METMKIDIGALNEKKKQTKVTKWQFISIKMKVKRGVSIAANSKFRKILKTEEK